MSHPSLYNVYLAIFTKFFLQFSQGFFAHPVNSKGIVVFYIFQRLINIFKDDFTQLQDKSGTKDTFFQIPGVFQDRGQIQGLFQVCVNPVQ